MPSSRILFPLFADPTDDTPYGGQQGSSCDSDRVDYKIFSAFVKIVSNAVTSSIAVLVLFIGAIMVIAYLVYRCLKDHGLPSINIKTAGGGAHGGSSELTPLLSSPGRDATTERFLHEITHERHVRFTRQQLELYTQHMSVQLGAGGSGAVYKGMLPTGGGLAIAVKVLHEKNSGVSDEVTERQFTAEVGALWRTSHANVIRLVGYCYDGGLAAGGGGMMKALVYEFMPNGSLDEYLFDRRRRARAPELLAIAAGVARGLRYLHEECPEKKIVHCDVKAGNVLLDAAMAPKLTDFGLAQVLGRGDAHAAVRAGCGTVGYMAREVVDGDGGTAGTAAITEKVDVYSFGILLFEIAVRRNKMDNGLPEADKWLPLLAWNMYRQGKLMELVKKYQNPMAAAEEDEEEWKETAERMCKVAFLCVRDPPEARPAMSVVVSMLEGHMEIPDPVVCPFG